MVMKQTVVLGPLVYEFDRVEGDEPCVALAWPLNPRRGSLCVGENRVSRKRLLSMMDITGTHEAVVSPLHNTPTPTRSYTHTRVF